MGDLVSGSVVRNLRRLLDKMKYSKGFVVTLLTEFLVNVSGHARFLEPPSRSSMWRFGFGTPADYQDNEGFCGGFAVQWNTENNGRCGICGDQADLPVRQHESPGGIYANGVIVREYTEGQMIDVVIEVTANHKGHFTFKICPNNDVTQDPTQDCFDEPDNLLKVLPDLSGTFPLSSSNTGKYDVRLQLPEGLECEQCILQWTYTAGNNWGTCEDGTGALGCGNQEHFRACADVKITENGGATRQTSTTEATTGPESTSTDEDTTQTENHTTPTEEQVTAAEEQTTPSEEQTTNTGTETTWTTTSSSTSTTSASDSGDGLACVPVGPYTRVPGMEAWCNTNCNWTPPNCPSSHCSCS